MSRVTLRVIELKENQGTGNALRVAMEHCTYPLAAHMDSDDVSARDRFARQLAFFADHPQVDVLGGCITEFVGEERNITGRRTVPLEDSEIKAYMKKRCPMNHASVMYKKTAVLNAGSYRDWPGNEDYDLWLRMAQDQCVFANLEEDLVNVRTGSDMAARRGGWKYFQSERGIQQCMRRAGLISCPEYLYNLALRFGGEVLAPNWLRRKLFRFLRKPYRPEAENEQQVSGKMTGETISDGETSDERIAGEAFSVTMAVYGGDRPQWFDRALASIITEQTVKPAEVVLVVDGPISRELRDVIHKYEDICAAQTETKEAGDGVL